MSAKKTLSEYMNGVTRVGMLTIVDDAPSIMSGGNYRRMVRCRCDCGTEKDFDATNVRRGLSKSCGCQFYRKPSPINEVCGGSRHGLLTVIGDTRRKRAVKGAAIRLAICQCDCGNRTEVAPYDLRMGMIKSCGCKPKRTRKTHGMTKTAEYAIWAGMKSRATNPNDKAWPQYGGRGIGMCEKWERFEGFFEDMGARPNPKLSLDRVDNNKGYSKENCEWGTKKQQARNRRCIERIVIAGEDMSVPELSELSGLSSQWVRQKMKEGMNGDEIVSSVIEALAKLQKR